MDGCGLSLFIEPFHMFAFILFLFAIFMIFLVLRVIGMVCICLYQRAWFLLCWARHWDSKELFLTSYLAYSISISKDVYLVSIRFSIISGNLFITGLQINVMRAVGIWIKKNICMKCYMVQRTQSIIPVWTMHCGLHNPVWDSLVSFVTKPKLSMNFYHVLINCGSSFPPKHCQNVWNA